MCHGLVIHLHSTLTAMPHVVHHPPPPSVSYCTAIRRIHPPTPLLLERDPPRDLGSRTRHEISLKTPFTFLIESSARHGPAHRYDIPCQLRPSFFVPSLLPWFGYVLGRKTRTASRCSCWTRRARCLKSVSLTCSDKSCAGLWQAVRCHRRRRAWRQWCRTLLRILYAKLGGASLKLRTYPLGRYFLAHFFSSDTGVFFLFISFVRGCILTALPLCSGVLTCSILVHPDTWAVQRRILFCCQRVDVATLTSREQPLYGALIADS